jgi:adenosylcobinamide-phosphate synthase
MLFNAGCLGVLLSTRSLRRESMAVYHAIKAGDIIGARQALAMIVGRDTKALDSEAISRAAVETVAENSSDGVIAPLFFFAIGGAPACFLYKAVNTLDSMIGYKNEKYLYFGRFAARMDDVFNYIPAVLTAWLSIAAAKVLGFNYKQALQIYKRDKNNHPSPNSGKPEAVYAGALGLQLGGSSSYGGKVVSKATIGDKIKAADYADISKANTLMTATAALAVALAALITILI